MNPRIYTYKITFPHQGWWYWGVHKEKRYGEVYNGSPITHAEKWKNFEFEKQILEFFDTYEEARDVEVRLIQPDLNNPLCLNEGCGGSYSTYNQSEKMKKWHSLQDKEWKEAMRERGRRLGAIGRENSQKMNAALTPEKRSAMARNRRDWDKVVERMREMGSKQKGSRYATNGKDNVRVYDGILPDGFYWGHTQKEHRSANYTWKCLVTGKISNGAGLTRFQKARGIDTSLREKVE